MNEDQGNTLSDLHYLVANKNYWVDRWHQPDTSFEMWRAIDESIELIESLKDDAKFFKDELATIAKKEKDDTLFEDYVEIREMVTGEGSVYTITHGEFLDVIANLIEQREK